MHVYSFILAQSMLKLLHIMAETSLASRSYPQMLPGYGAPGMPAHVHPGGFIGHPQGPGVLPLRGRILAIESELPFTLKTPAVVERQVAHFQVHADILLSRLAQHSCMNLQLLLRAPLPS